MKRPMIALSVAAMLAMPSFAKVVRNEDGPPGLFTVSGINGETWKGRCLRDGFLNKSPIEVCTVSLTGASIDIHMTRTVKGLSVAASFEGCKKDATRRGWMGPKALASKGRAARLETMINGFVRGNKPACAIETDLPAPIERSELAEILKETDGLEF